jgi:hypothetical protein
MATFPVPGIPNLTVTTIYELPDGSAIMRLEADTDMRVAVQNAAGEEITVLLLKPGVPTNTHVPGGGMIMALPLVSGPQKFRQ